MKNKLRWYWYKFCLFECWLFGHSLVELAHGKHRTCDLFPSNPNIDTSHTTHIPYNYVRCRRCGKIGDSRLLTKWIEY